MNSYFYKQVVSHQNATLNQLKEKFGIEITGAEKLDLILKLAVIPSADLLQEKLDVHLGTLIDGLDAQTREVAVVTHNHQTVDHGEYGYSFRSTNGFSLAASVSENGDRHCTLQGSHGNLLMDLEESLDAPSGKVMGDVLRAMQIEAISATYNATLGANPRQSNVVSLQAVELKRFLEYKEIDVDSRAMAEILATINGAPDLETFESRFGINLTGAFEDIRQGIVDGIEAGSPASKYFFIHANSLVPSVSVVDFDNEGDVSKLTIRTLDGEEQSVVTSAEFPTLFSFASKMANDMRGLELENMNVVSEFYADLAREDDYDYDEDEDDEEVFAAPPALKQGTNEADVEQAPAAEAPTVAESSATVDAASEASATSEPKPEVNAPQTEDPSSEVKKNLFKPMGRFGF